MWHGEHPAGPVGGSRRRTGVCRRSGWARAWRAERYRFLSLRSQRWLFGLAALSALGLGLGQILALGAGTGAQGVLRAGLSGVEISPFFVGLSSALFCAADLSSRQFALTLLQLGSRHLAFVAKVVVLLVAASTTGAAAILVLAPLAMARGAGVAVLASSQWLVLPALQMAFALLGAAIGMVARSVVGAVFVYLAVVWALPLLAAVAGIWFPAISGPVLQMAPITLTAGIVDQSGQWSAAMRFAALDAVLLVVGFARVARWRVR